MMLTCKFKEIHASYSDSCHILVNISLKPSVIALIVLAICRARNTIKLNNASQHVVRLQIQHSIFYILYIYYTYTLILLNNYMAYMYSVKKQELNCKQSLASRLS